MKKFDAKKLKKFSEIILGIILGNLMSRRFKGSRRCLDSELPKGLIVILTRPVLKRALLQKGEKAMTPKFVSCDETLSVYSFLR